MQKIHDALTIIDMDRCFMPAAEGERLDLPGFGELPVPEAEELVPVINTIYAATHRLNWLTAYTTEAHPPETAHFSDQPNFVDTWPVHGISGTPGSQLHPELDFAGAQQSICFQKGMMAARTPAEDTSYSGVNAIDPVTSTTLPEYFEQHDIRTATLVGVALGNGDTHKLCVDSTAFDLRDLGFQVRVITDAVKAVLPENRSRCLSAMSRYGISLVSSQEFIADLH